jgi:hypothetical protein
VVLLKSDYECVGPGWEPILKALDSYISNVLGNSKTMSSCKVLQIKEKFGGLRFYFETEGLGEKQKAQIWGAVCMAENMSYRTCEVCGNTGETSTEAKRGTEKGMRAGRTLTLCEEHHQQRADEGKIEFGRFKCH